jgi:hypothetical protein
VANGVSTQWSSIVTTTPAQTLPRARQLIRRCSMWLTRTLHLPLESPPRQLALVVLLVVLLVALLVALLVLLLVDLLVVLLKLTHWWAKALVWMEQDRMGPAVWRSRKVQMAVLRTPTVKHGATRKPHAQVMMTGTRAACITRS